MFLVTGCGRPNEIINFGTIDVQADSYGPGEILQYTCDGGYGTRDAASTVCSFDSGTSTFSWSLDGSVPICTRGKLRSHLFLFDKIYMYFIDVYF